ncbi:prepilin-type N-terminal cleavage/methylation domain-containing protein [Fusibacter tunisiensis]|uniref:Prepilin-type N-terminal cleavage/methylation domain-containing protein n=1 Tax=Fusibacter tunisiensis TaxID=1008308 RepID=A0ABS2MPP8_9FIRM|nr:prepilin-type N-terminal cleavage/methylation domain-containing protein [Fusibacter tunisiensis]MBM7561386.1 prepilin-type N-terminal cleavage/methylation domain-containing protein [Fusibacter tunisiensis]
MNIKKYKGFTLIELMITIALISIVIMVSTSMIGLVTTAHTRTVNEYEINTMIRIASQEINEIVRYSKAVFAVPVSYVQDPEKMDPGWRYFTVSKDQKRIVVYEYSEIDGKHIETVLVEESPGVTYEVIYEKDTTSSNDKMLKYKIIGYVMGEDGDGNPVRTDEKIVYETEIEAQNSLQVVDKGTELSPSVALAFRNDSSAQGTGRTQVATISLVLDVSGSMDNSLNGNTRLGHLKNALLGYTKADGTVVEGVINTFARENNIEVVIVPFSDTANYPDINSYSNDEHPFYNAEDDYSSLVDTVNNLRTYNMTNTGDGLRRALYRHIDFDPETAGYNEHTEKYNYMIVLVDGNTNRSSWLGNGDGWWIFTSFDAYNQHTDRGGIYPYISYDGETRVYPYSRDNDAYITLIGDLIKNSSISSYVIGFESGITSQISHIGTSIGAKQIYNYNEDFNLDEVFDNIAQDIMAELWLVTGPQIIN